MVEASILIEGPLIAFYFSKIIGHTLTIIRVKYFFLENNPKAILSSYGRNERTDQYNRRNISIAPKSAFSSIILRRVDRKV